jgi:hypothetical protein
VRMPGFFPRLIPSRPMHTHVRLHHPLYLQSVRLPPIMPYHNFYWDSEAILCKKVLVLCDIDKSKIFSRDCANGNRFRRPGYFFWRVLERPDASSTTTAAMRMITPAFFFRKILGVYLRKYLMFPLSW